MHAKSPLTITIFAGLLMLVTSQAAVWAQLPSLPPSAASPNTTDPLQDPISTAAAAESVRAVEAQVRQMQDLSRRQQEELTDIRQRMASAESAGKWIPWLLLGFVAALGAVSWQSMRVRRLQRERKQREWALIEAERQAALVPESSAPTDLLPPDRSLLSPRTPSLPAALSNSAGLGLPAQRASVASPAELATPPPPPLPAPPAPPPLAPSRGTPSLPPGGPRSAPASSEASQSSRTLSLASGVPPRAVSADEMLDLDQQVDFFMVLGQQQAAIDLLLGHVRATGGISALPYFKLLAIYREQGDEDAYERTRERFNQRFNANAPDWQGDLLAGRDLTDYPVVVARLARAWALPLRATAEIESLLLRRTELEPFDLPAFHDLVTLHALLRDSVEQVASEPVSQRQADLETTQTLRMATPVTDATIVLAPVGMGLMGSAAAAAEPVDFFLPLDGEPTDVTEPRPRMSEPGAARAMLADWMQARSNIRRPALDADSGWEATTARKSPKVDLDLSDFAPAPREFTRPAAFTDVDMRRETRLSDLSSFDDSDLLPPSISRR